MLVLVLLVSLLLLYNCHHTGHSPLGESSSSASPVLLSLSCFVPLMQSLHSPLCMHLPSLLAALNAGWGSVGSGGVIYSPAVPAASVSSIITGAVLCPVGCPAREEAQQPQRRCRSSVAPRSRHHPAPAGPTAAGLRLRPTAVSGAADSCRWCSSTDVDGAAESCICIWIMVQLKSVNCAADRCKGCATDSSRWCS